VGHSGLYFSLAFFFFKQKKTNFVCFTIFNLGKKKIYSNNFQQYKKKFKAGGLGQQFFKLVFFLSQTLKKQSFDQTKLNLNFFFLRFTTSNVFNFYTSVYIKIFTQTQKHLKKLFKKKGLRLDCGFRTKVFFLFGSFFGNKLKTEEGK